jgi:hypothetical protein
MADISTLAGLAPVEQLDLENYAVNTPKPAFRLPRRGVYTLQAPSEFKSDAFGVSKKGALAVQIDPTIVAGDHSGFQLKYIRVYGTTFKRDGVTVSQIGDYLKACGVGGVFTTPQELADAIESTAGLTYQAELDWQLFKRGAGENGADLNIEGMQNFPKDADGQPQPWVNHSTEVNDDGSPKRMWANLYIRNFVSQ